MPTISGYTVSELAEKTGKTPHAIRCLLSIHKIKPLSYEAIYPAEVLELVATKRGRPAKAKADK